MQVYLIDIPIDKIKATYDDPKPKLNRGIFQELVISEYNRGVTYSSVKYNFYAKNMAFICTGYNLHDILDNGMQYPVSLYIDNYGDILAPFIAEKLFRRLSTTAKAPESSVVRWS